MVFVPSPIFPSSFQQAERIVSVERRGIIILVIYKLAMGCHLYSKATAIQVSENPCNKSNVAEIALPSPCFFRESSAGNK